MVVERSGKLRGLGHELTLSVRQRFYFVVIEHDNLIRNQACRQPNGLDGNRAESEAINYKIATPDRLSHRPFLAKYCRINLPTYGNDRRRE